MIQLDFLNFLESNYFWSFCYTFLFCLPIYLIIYLFNYTNVVNVYLLLYLILGKLLNIVIIRLNVFAKML